MPNENDVALMGRLVAAPEVKFTPGGNAVASFSLAVNDYYKDKEGKRQEKTHFIQCVIWNKPAETFADHVKKGELLQVKGSLTQNRWETQDGQKRDRVEVTVRTWQFLETKKNREEE